MQLDRDKNESRNHRNLFEHIFQKTITNCWQQCTYV